MIVEIASGYGVDELGQVYSCRSINGKGSGRHPWRPVKALPSSGGRYLQVGIDKRKHSVHRLVARAFLGTCPPGHEVAHKNGDGHDNRASNLAYVTHRYNERMKRTHGTSPDGSRNGGAVLSQADVSIIRNEAASGARGTQRRLARRFGVSESTISQVVNGKRWAAARKEA